MTQLQVVLAALPIAFALHNLEELRGFDRMRRLYYRRIPWLPFARAIDRSAFRTAVCALTLAVSAILIGRCFSSSTILDFSVRAIFCALLLNSFQHIALSLASRTLEPGVLTATFLLLPLCLAGLSAEFYLHPHPIPAFLLALAAGAILLPVAVSFSLGLGLLLRKVAH